MTKPTAAANATGLPEDPLSHHVDEARYSVGIAADLCQALTMACQAIPEPQRTGLLAIAREIDTRTDAAYAALDTAYVKALAAEVRP